ncbi:MAG: S9 family peptidase [Pseudomonadota bacterium]
MTQHFPAPANAPAADKESFSQTVHGIELVDPYQWLRADNWQEAMREPEKLPDAIKNYLSAENNYYEACMADTEKLQTRLISEMRGRIKEEDNSVPVKQGPYAYAWKFVEGGEHPIRIRTGRNGGDETVLLDVNKEAETHDYFELGFVGENPSHSIMAWSRDISGAEYYDLVFRDLVTSTDSEYALKDVGSVAWGDDQTLFYSKVDENHRPSKVYRHILGNDQSSDVLVYEEKDPRFYCGVGRSRSGDYIFLSAGMNDQDEIRFIPTSQLDGEPTLIEPRTEGLEYSVDHQGENFVILTNANGATDFKIVSVPIKTPGIQNWREVVEHKPGRMLLSIDAYADWLIWMERENALPKICFMNTAGDIDDIVFDEQAYALGVSPSPEFDQDILRFTYSSPTTPTQVYEFDLQSQTREFLKQTEIPSGHDNADYVTQRIFAKSHDGAKVPITILYHKSTKLDGSAPCLLYGYGSYGMSMPAGFSANRLSLVDRGFIYATAHIRGGQEKGRAWYEDAKFGKKPNTFHDFIAAGETLATESFTKRGNIVIMGGSAGGLLVGACVNMAPDLFAGVIADVPFVDVLNTILDDTLPLTPGEWSQWGNPIESKQAFDDIRGYSPYDNLKERDYPAMLVTAGVSDPRVTYWEPAKWVAKLRTLKTDNNVLMLRTNMTSGHFGKSGRFAALEDAARSYAFALKAVGKT